MLMNVMPELIRRTKSAPDIEDLALLFMEEEVGRFDWAANWKKLRADGVAEKRIQEWLDALNCDCDPREIAFYLDGMAENRTGRWI